MARQVKETVIVDDTDPVVSKKVSTVSTHVPADERVGFKTYQIIYYLFGILEVLLTLRFTLKALAANPGSPFVNFIYGITYPFVFPFQGIFRSPAGGGAMLEWSTLIAMIIYALIAYGLGELIRVLVSKPGETTVIEE